MATNTKNNASQTLFRFVSLRNPQLTETKKQNLGFIHRPSGLVSDFDAVINPGDSAQIKFQAMERKAKEFNTTGYQSENIIETGPLSEALKIGRKLAKRETISPADESTAKNLYNSIAVQNTMSEVWDNLIYQTVTQKDFYVKEALVHILKALHFGYVCDMPLTPELTQINGGDLKAKALEARVVLPMKFFGDGSEGEIPSEVSNNNAFQVNVSKIGAGVISGTELSFADRLQLQNEGQRISEVLQLDMEKDSLITLKSELEKIQKLYHTVKNKTYESAYKDYLAKNQPKIDAYNALAEKIEEQIEKGSLSEQEIKALYASLEESAVVPFVFEYKNEVNFQDLKDNLSHESFQIFVNLFTKVASGQKPEEGFDYSVIKVLTDKTLLLGTVTVSIPAESDTFKEILESLDKGISSLAQDLFKKAPLSEQTYASLGGVLIPVVNSYSQTARAVSRSYYLKATYEPMYSRAAGSVTFYYQAGSDSWGAAAVKVNTTTDFGTYEESFSNVEVRDGKVSLPLFLIDRFGKAIRSLTIKVFFNNGKEASLELADVEINHPYTGILYTDDVKDETGNPATPGVFIPKHFGVKRLGIADYLKVEQSVHAYVPGEVSNIENVMASELRHKSSVSRDYSEITDTTSEAIETEKISDTSKAERAEMQTEVAREIEKQQSITASTHFGYSGGYTLDISAGYANNTAQHDSTRQAVAKSQEITERAMERVLTKINKERVQKIIKEFTETNVHEFDNRGKEFGKTPQHITGVYRWVDKKMKNQIYNYGKRTMFEFMIPEPARLHTLAAFSTKQTLKAPVDPRTAPSPQTMTDSKSATKDLLAYWAGIYGVKMTEIKEKDKQVETLRDQFNDDGNCVVVQRNFTVTPNYVCKSVDVSYTASREKSSRRIEITGDFTNGIGFQRGVASDVFSMGGFNMSGNWIFKNSGYNIGTVDFSLTLNLEILPEIFEVWKKENFEAVIKAYEAAYAEFLAKQKEADEKLKEQEANNKKSLEGINFYRDIESVILKHNCMAYLLQDYGALGKNFTNNATEMKDFSIMLSDNLEQYTALAKFMEQAFEWSIMDYTFYPYYWGNKDSWQKMYLSQSTDPLFRSFLQAGMARVVVTVKPGFEDAVQFFMCTGKIWNGGEVPVIGDPLYMSIVDELRQPTGEAQGKYWITRIPTTLTILQAESVGLKVDQPLPIFPENEPDKCENPKDLETATSFFKDEEIRMEPGPGTSTLG